MSALHRSVSDDYRVTPARAVIVLVWFEVALLLLSDGGGNLGAILLWLLATLCLACLWLFFLGQTLWRTLREQRCSLARLLTLVFSPLFLLVLYAESELNIGRDLRFRLGEAALTRAAVSDSPYADGRGGKLIGAFMVTEIGDFHDCRHFRIANMGRDAGFAYCPDGKPTASELQLSPFRYEHQQGDWYRYKNLD